MPAEERKKWNVEAKIASKSAEFRSLQIAHSRLQEQKPPRLGVRIPHQTYFTKNTKAGNFMNATFDNM